MSKSGLLFLWCLVFSFSAGVLGGDLVGKIEAGYDRSTGNTDSKDLLMRLHLKYTTGVWWTDSKLEVQRNSDNGEVNDFIVKLNVQANYNYNATDYWFSNLSFLHDEFASYDRQTSLSAGWGRHMIKTEVTMLNLEAGIGARVSRESVTGERTQEPVLIGHADWRYQANENTRLEQDLKVEAGNDNTYIVSETSLRVKMAESLGLRLSYVYKHNTTAPVGTEPTDTQTRLTIEYEF